MQYLSPTRLEDALQMLATHVPSVIAGGTDWYPAQGEAPVKCDLLDVTRIEGLRGIARSDAGWRIGGASTWSDIIAADLPPAFDGLKAAAREVGSVQIQNAGTVAGNLCNASPAADGVPPLLMLDAVVELQSAQGTRVLPLDQFLTGVRQTALGVDELVCAILIPEVSATRKSAFMKLGARKYLVISIAMVAVSFELENSVLRDMRIAVGACSPVALRLRGLERAVEGQALESVEGIVRDADLSMLSPIDDVRGSEVYRLDVVRSLIMRAINGVAHG